MAAATAATHPSATLASVLAGPPRAPRRPCATAAAVNATGAPITTPAKNAQPFAVKWGHGPPARTAKPVAAKEAQLTAPAWYLPTPSACAGRLRAARHKTATNALRTRMARVDARE
jgi:hypothetical protein